MTTSDEGTTPAAGPIDELADWLMVQALGDGQVEAVAEGCFRRLSAAGIPLQRAHVAFRTLHPLFDAMGLNWTPDQGLAVWTFQRDESGSGPWLRSPPHHLIKTGTPFLRRRLTGPKAVLDFPVLEEFRDQGATDYLVYLVVFDREMGTGIWGSWTTDRPSGFSDAEIRALQRIQQRFAVALKVTIKDQIARNVVATYLGTHAGGRVLSGQIQRGDGETIHAAIWYSDLRDSTSLAGAMAQEAFLELLNGYFECTAGAVLAHGGEVLLLIGDAVLAIFPAHHRDGNEVRACEAALAAAREARQRLDRLNEVRTGSGLGPLDFGVGLHLGEVVFGNIGVPERLQFTVVGPAANEVARLEDLTKDLDRPVLASLEFTERVALEWTSLGTHTLRGVEGPREVFVPPGPA
jgi:adenylate cyclase